MHASYVARGPARPVLRSVEAVLGRARVVIGTYFVCLANSAGVEQRFSFCFLLPEQGQRVHISIDTRSVSMTLGALQR